MVFQSAHQVVAITLFVAHSHVVEAAEATPYTHVTSPEKRSGKTRVLEAVEFLVRRPIRALDLSEAALYRIIQRDCPTLLWDEIDVVFRRRENEGRRGLLNGGYRRGAKVYRSNERGHLQEFAVFSPKMMAGIGELPDTVADRAIRIRLERRAPGEAVSKLRRREASKEAEPILRALEIWASPDTIETLGAARPQPPEGLNDRAEDAWEILFAIADMAGGEWPGRARRAALELSGDDTSAQSLGVRLLADV